MKEFERLTGIDPFELPFHDDAVMELFNSTKTLGIKKDDYEETHGCIGISEFGTPIVRRMVEETGPKCIGDLIRISGLSHGTDVYENNAKELISDGTITIKEAICTRDDIMTYLIAMGIPKEDAFNIMENVRRGIVAAGSFKKGGSCNTWDDAKRLMLNCDVPEWYIGSCEKIQYMFPRAHAVAYVMTSWREAWFKVHQPLAFYACYFTTKIGSFDARTILSGYNAVKERIKLITEQGRDAEKKDQDALPVLEIALEMFARGIEVSPPNFESSDPHRFLIDDGKILLPWEAISGVGASAAEGIANGYKTKKYVTVEDIMQIGKANTAVVDALDELGILDGMQRTNQYSMMDLL